MRLLKNIGVILFILLVFFMVWIFFIAGTEGDILDFSRFVDPFYDPLFLFVIIIILSSFSIYFGSDILFDLFLITLNMAQLLNKCPYCTKIRGEPERYLVDGNCGNPDCETAICKDCFKYTDKVGKTKQGCPECGSTVFLPDNLLAYPVRIPNWLKKRWVSKDAAE